jgi:hypothetical protein
MNNPTQAVEVVTSDSHSSTAHKIFLTLFCDFVSKRKLVSSCFFASSRRLV